LLKDRCHRNRATPRYIVAGRTGVEFIDLKTGKSLRHHWTRGTCQFGTVPSNGLLYVPPHPCFCYGDAMMTAFNAYETAATFNLPTALAADGGGEIYVVDKDNNRLQHFKVPGE